MSKYTAKISWSAGEVENPGLTLSLVFHYILLLKSESIPCTFPGNFCPIRLCLLRVFALS